METMREEIEKFKQEYNNGNEEHKQVMFTIAALEKFKWEQIYEFVNEQE